MRYTAVFIVGFLVLAGIFPHSSRAQSPPDNEAILESIVDMNSPYYYPVLMLRYNAGDSTLTQDDFRYLYYGYPWQDSYKPFETPPAKDSILQFVHDVRNFDDMDEAHLGKLAGFAEEVLKVEPFNPGTLNMLVYAYGRLGDKAKERLNHFKLQGVIDAIKSTGDGLKEKTAWHVLYFTHATDMMGVMGKFHKKAQVVSRTVEFMPLTIPEDKLKGYYFDYSRIYWFRPDKLPEKRSTGWNINGIPLRKK